MSAGKVDLLAIWDSMYEVCENEGIGTSGNEGELGRAALAGLIEAAGARVVMDGRGFHVVGRSGKRQHESFRYEHEANSWRRLWLDAALSRIGGAP